MVACFWSSDCEKLCSVLYISVGVKIGVLTEQKGFVGNCQCHNSHRMKKETKKKSWRDLMYVYKTHVKKNQSGAG